MVFYYVFPINTVIKMPGSNPFNPRRRSQLKFIDWHYIKMALSTNIFKNAVPRNEVDWNRFTLVTLLSLRRYKKTRFFPSLLICMLLWNQRSQKVGKIGNIKYHFDYTAFIQNGGVRKCSVFNCRGTTIFRNLIRGMKWW